MAFAGGPCAKSDVTNTAVVANSVAPRIGFIDILLSALPGLSGVATAILLRQVHQSSTSSVRFLAALA